MRVIADDILSRSISEGIKKIKPRKVRYLELTKDEVEELKLESLSEIAKDLPESYCGINIVIVGGLGNEISR